MPPSRRGGWNQAMEKVPVRGEGWAEKATRLDRQNTHYHSICRELLSESGTVDPSPTSVCK